MVSADGREVTVGALLEVEQVVVSNGRQNKKLPCALPEWLGYKNWEDSSLIKFSEYLGVPTMGFEVDAKNGASATKRTKEGELRKLECTINYNEKGHNREGRDRGNLLLKLK